MAINPHTAHVGMKCKTPSGLGGVFDVEVLELTSTDALVKNSGNCEDFDDAPAYRRPLDQLTDITPSQAAARRIASEIATNGHTTALLILADQLPHKGYSADAERAELTEIHQRHMASGSIASADYERRREIQIGLLQQLDRLMGNYQIKKADYTALRTAF